MEVSGPSPSNRGTAISRRRSPSSSGISDDATSDNEGEQIQWPYQCLFCNQEFAIDDSGFEANLEHMRATHGMSIPDLEMVADVQSLVGYLATEVRAWHECLYCGATKPSTRSIQSHMRDKGHCLLNLDREPELLDFWENSQPASEQDRPTHLSSTEMRFASGKIIGSRHATVAPATSRSSRSRELAIRAQPPDPEDAESAPPLFEPPPASGRQLARREEMGIIGVTAQQRQALVLAVKRAQRSEDVARRAREWVSAKASNTLKYDQVDVKMKMGKQNHKLQPR